MKIRIETSGGRHLGTYEADDTTNALTQYVVENGYNDIEHASAKRFISVERLEFTEQVAA